MPRLALTALLVLALAPPAGATPKLRDLGPAHPPLVTDGQQLAHASAAGAVVRAADGRARRTVPPPRAGCGPTGLSFGTLLWECSADGRYDGALLDLTTGAATPLAAAPIPPLDAGGSTGHWRGLGLRHLAVWYTGYRSHGWLYVDRATGKLVPEPREPRTVVADLDAPGLWRRLCEPLRRRLVPDDYNGVGTEVGPYAYRPPYGATRSYFEDRLSGTVILERCGRDRVEVLGTCGHGCSDPVLSRELVAWVRRGVRSGRAMLHVRDLDRRRTWSFGVRSPQGLVVVGRRVFVLDGRRLRTVVLPAVRHR